MTGSLANLASTSEGDVLELVWENGQIHMRGRSGITQKGQSCISYSLYPSNAQAENGGDIHTKRASRSGTIYFDPSTSQRQASDSLFRQRVNSPLHKSNLLEHGSSTHDKNTGKPNFSYLQPPSILKANGKSSTGATSGAVLSRVEELKVSKNDNPLVPSKSVRGLQNQPDLLPIKAELIPPVAQTQESLPDEHSEAFVTRKRNSHDQFIGQTSSLAETPLNGKPPVASSSICSLGASNDLTYALRRTYEDSEESEYPCENVEEPEGFTKARRSKRSRTAQVHNYSGRRRRDEINKKMRALKELIPNCNKMDKVSMLDEAIQYLKTLQLQLQLQIMLMGSGVCMPPMMLPSVNFSPMGTGIACSCSPAQFPTSQTLSNALPGIAGFPMSLPHASFFPFLGRATQSVMAPGISGPNPPEQHLGSAPLTISKDSIQNINSEMKYNANVECSKIQTSSPGNERRFQTLCFGAKE